MEHAVSITKSYVPCDDKFTVRLYVFSHKPTEHSHDPPSVRLTAESCIDTTLGTRFTGSWLYSVSSRDAFNDIYV